MKKKKSVFNDKQRRIIQELSKSRIGLTPYSISKRTGISWITAKKHIKKLQAKKIVKCPRISPNKKICKLNYDLIYGKKRKK
jgi:predicted ArsR family transcriptional regulator